MDFLLAQADASLPSLYYEIARTGLLGVLFVLCIYALVKRDRELQEARKGRLEDAKNLRSMIEAATASQVEQNKIQEEHNRLTERMIAMLNELTARK
jgi:hypothetical protein